MARAPIDDTLPEPDRLEGAPHPRETPHLFGHSQAQTDFLDAFNSHRLHHAWLLCGPRGIGKATLAWKLARFLLATPEDDGGFFAPEKPTTLDIPEDHPTAHHLRALADPRFRLIRRTANDKGDRLRSVISVEDIRKLKEELSLSAPDGGRRAVIIDSADEMNPQAANALLKLLEEPPAKVTMLLIAHQPAKLLPTIRSRCRTLALWPLSPPDLSDALTQAGAELDPADAQALAELAGGSVGAAFRLIGQDAVPSPPRPVELHRRGCCCWQCSSRTTLAIIWMIMMLHFPQKYNMIYMVNMPPLPSSSLSATVMTSSKVFAWRMWLVVLKGEGGRHSYSFSEAMGRASEEQRETSHPICSATIPCTRRTTCCSLSLSSSVFSQWT